MPEASSRSAPSEPLSWRKRPIHESHLAQNELTVIITWLHVTQKSYGADANSLRIRDKDFQKKLGHFCIDEVAAAIEEYTCRRDDVPAAANILHILEPPQPIPDRAVVREIRQRRQSNQYVSEEEIEVCRLARRYEVERVMKEQQRYEQNKARRSAAQISYQPLKDDEAA